MADYPAVLSRLKDKSAAMARAAGENERLLLEMLEQHRDALSIKAFHDLSVERFCFFSACSLLRNRNTLPFFLNTRFIKSFL